MKLYICVIIWTVILLVKLPKQAGSTISAVDKFNAISVCKDRGLGVYETFDGNWCCLCAPGKFRKHDCKPFNERLPNTTDCRPCPFDPEDPENQSFTTDQNNQTMCNRSHGGDYCDPYQNTHRHSGSITENSRCECIEGHHPANQNDFRHGCHPHGPCMEGFEPISEGNKANDTRCQRCPDGHYSNVSSPNASCIKHTPCSLMEVIVEGNAINDSVCNITTLPAAPVIGHLPTAAAVGITVVVVAVVVVVSLVLWRFCCRGVKCYEQRVKSPSDSESAIPMDNIKSQPQSNGIPAPDQGHAHSNHAAPAASSEPSGTGSGHCLANENNPVDTNADNQGQSSVMDESELSPLLPAPNTSAEDSITPTIQGNQCHDVDPQLDEAQAGESGDNLEASDAASNEQSRSGDFAAINVDDGVLAENKAQPFGPNPCQAEQVPLRPINKDNYTHFATDSDLNEASEKGCHECCIQKQLQNPRLCEAILGTLNEQATDDILPLIRCFLKDHEIKDIRKAEGSNPKTERYELIRKTWRKKGRTLTPVKIFEQSSVVDGKIKDDMAIEFFKHLEVCH